MRNVDRYGRVKFDRDMRITSFAEKAVGPGSGWINAGIYAFGRDLIASIPQDQAVSLEKDMFPLWLGKGLYGFKVHEPFIDIGTPESFAKAVVFLAMADDCVITRG